MPSPLPLRILIVGAGFSGLGAAISLKRAGFDYHLTVIDRGADVGGTWRDNQYPGCACDVPSHLYSFSFDADFDWDHTHARQPQILAYLQGLVDRHGLRPHLRLNTEVRGADWQEDRAVWRVTLGDGEVLEAEVLVSAVGGLVKPAMPEIEGLADFTGPVVHSARWRHDIDLAGRRVAIVGTGASAVQVAPALAARAGHLEVFQRSAPWVLPRHDRAHGPRRRWLYRHLPLLRRLNRWRIYALNEFAALGFLGNRWVQGLLESMARRHLRRQVADPALRERLAPADRLGCRRLLVSDDWYPMFSRPNVSIATGRIVRATAEGLVTDDGRLHPADALVLCTGFHLSGGLARARGRGGVRLGERWAVAAKTHLGLVTHGFPHLYTLLGPGTGLGFNSVVFMLEAQLTYLVQAVRHRADTGAVLDVRDDVQEASDAALQQRLQRTVWASGCRSWYRSPSGRIDALWPDFSFNYWRRTRHFDASVYDVRPRPRAPTPDAPEAAP